MALSPDLQFDKMEVDTKFAKDYIKRHKSEFYPKGVAVDHDSTSHDGAGNKIYYSSPEALLQISSEQEGGLEYHAKLVALADNIQNNVNVFCQLEYLIRQKPIQSTMLELNMIMKHLRYQASLPVHKSCQLTLLKMKNDSPLIDLGYITFLPSTIHILAAENTAAVCHLFTELCQFTGISAVKLSILPNDHVAFDNHGVFTKRKDVAGGCIGVVTAQSDVDSAVDVLLSAPKGVSDLTLIRARVVAPLNRTQDLWGIRRILVQESATERFKTEFAWKTRSGSLAKVKPELKSLCTDVYVHDGKTYLREYVGCDTARDMVLIESFRTIQELLSLMDSYSPFCVSLWSHGVAESNEIAFNSTAPIVWVNCHGILGVANEISLAYYSQYYTIYTDSEIDKVLKLQKDWKKLTYTERYKTVITSINSNDIAHKIILKCKSRSACSKNFAHVSDGSVVVGVCEPRELYVIDLGKDSDVVDFLQNLFSGSGFLINTPLDDIDGLKTFLSRLIEKRLPIHFASKPFTSDPFPLPQVTRVIHTNFGTIFTK